MQKRSITATPSEIIVEQLAALGVQYVFNNSGSREALFFDALHVNPNVHGILALHEGSVAAMAGGYTQGNLDPAVMVVHLGAGLSQCLGQLINVWSGSLPVVVLTFAGDTGSYGDRVGLDLTHNVGPTSIAAPFTKASWTVIEPDGLPQAIERALRVAKTPPVGPVHLAVYDRLLGNEKVTTDIIEGEIQSVRAGYPADEDVEAVIRALSDAQRPLFYVGDGIWKSGAEARVTALAEQYGCPIAGTWTEMRRVPRSHRLHCGRIAEAVVEVSPDLIVCIGVRHNGRGKPQDFDVLSGQMSKISRIFRGWISRFWQMSSGRLNVLNALRLRCLLPSASPAPRCMLLHFTQSAKRRQSAWRVRPGKLDPGCWWMLLIRVWRGWAGG